jgi:hypothetical protein
MDLMDPGRQIDSSAEQCENPDALTNASFELLSKVTLERFMHVEKQSSQMISTDDGMQIERSEQHE